MAPKARASRTLKSPKETAEKSKAKAAVTGKTTAKVKKTTAPTKNASAEKATKAKATTKASTAATSKAKQPAVSKAKAKDSTTTTKTTVSKAKASTKTKVPAKAKATAEPKTASKSKSTKVRASKNAVPNDTGVTDAPTASEKPVANMKRKRDSGAAAEPPAKKAKVVLSHAPTQRLNVYVCGEGGNGELGLGTKKATNVKRPRLNPNLSADSVGVVQLSCGGMHTLALTHDNKIYSWGINDSDTLGRDTTAGEVLKDMKEGDESGSDDDESDDGEGLNAKEATPAAISADSFPEGTTFVQVAASDSGSFALTDDGFVYGWGTFRDSAGVFGFAKAPGGRATEGQKTPVLIPGLKNIIQISAGGDHVLALDKAGSVWAWGSGDSGELGRRFMERRKYDSLVPGRVALPRGKVASVHCGMHNSFAVMKDGTAYSWGLNNYGQCGVPTLAGEDSAALFKPEKLKSLTEPITMLQSGNMHSVALTASGKTLVFGRLDNDQAGMDISSIPEEDIKRNEHGKPAILLKPTVCPNVPKAVFVTAGSEHVIAITEEGKPYTWGFNSCYQLGNGDESGADVGIATLVENTAIKDKKLTAASAGGQFSMFVGPA